MSEQREKEREDAEKEEERVLAPRKRTIDELDNTLSVYGTLSFLRKPPTRRSPIISETPTPTTTSMALILPPYSAQNLNSSPLPHTTSCSTTPVQNGTYFTTRVNLPFHDIRSGMQSPTGEFVGGRTTDTTSMQIDFQDLANLNIVLPNDSSMEGIMAGAAI